MSGSSGDGDTPVLRTREDLLRALDVASQLEHLLLCQYLFAALTLKRSAREGLSEPDVERVRRWGSKVTLIARQEMEHLGLVMNLRSAIGGMPYFRRPSFPQRPSYFGPAALDQELTRFEQSTLERFQWAEQPHPVPEIPWCSLGAEEVARERARLMAPLSKLPTAGGDAGRLSPPTFEFDSVQALYLALRDGFARVTSRLGEDALFIGSLGQQIYGGAGSPYAGGMNDLNQYGLDLVPVTNLQSATSAIDLILLQGEGLLAPPDYVEHTHYCLFTSILDEMKTVPGLDCARPVVRNPLTAMHPDITAPEKVNLITRPETLEVAVVSNRCYELMLSMLLWLYGHPEKSASEGAALTDAVFFPLMTMFVRPLGEILTELPAFTDRPGNAGPGFELFSDVLVLPATGDCWALFQEKLDGLVWDFANLRILGMKNDYPRIVERLGYLGENMGRLAMDWRTGWKDVGRDG